MDKSQISAAERRGLIVLTVILAVIVAVLAGVRLSRPEVSEILPQAETTAPTDTLVADSSAVSKPDTGKRKKIRKRKSGKTQPSRSDRNPLDERPL